MFIFRYSYQLQVNQFVTKLYCSLILCHYIISSTKPISLLYRLINAKYTVLVNIVDV